MLIYQRVASGFMTARVCELEAMAQIGPVEIVDFPVEHGDVL